jgi:hypothetical protein
MRTSVPQPDVIVLDVFDTDLHFRVALSPDDAENLAGLLATSAGEARLAGAQPTTEGD